MRAEIQLGIDEATTVPTQFLGQFSGPSWLQPFVPDFQYILFDTNVWNWQEESCRELRDNVFLLSALLLLKAAFHKDLELIRQVFQLWHQLGFTQETERIIFLLIYISATHELNYKQLNTMLDECKLKGDEIMPTLAQRWMEEGMLTDKQQVLIMQLSSRFRLTELEKQQILKINEPHRLDEALRMVIKAKKKGEVLAGLLSFSNS